METASKPTAARVPRRIGVGVIWGTVLVVAGLALLVHIVFLLPEPEETWPEEAMEVSGALMGLPMGIAIYDSLWGPGDEIWYYDAGVPVDSRLVLISKPDFQVSMGEARRWRFISLLAYMVFILGTAQMCFVLFRTSRGGAAAWRVISAGGMFLVIGGVGAFFSAFYYPDILDIVYRAGAVAGTVGLAFGARSLARLVG